MEFMMKLINMFFLLISFTSALFADVNQDFLESLTHDDFPRAESLLKDGADINMEVVYYGSPLLWAVLQNDMGKVRFLVSHGADVNKEWVDSFPLMFAVRASNLEMVRFLIENGANLKIASGVYKHVPLVEATLFGKIDIFNYLIEQNVDVNIRNDGGSTALHWATEHYIEMVHRLVSRGAQVNLQNNDGYTALSKAVMRNNGEIVKFLLHCGADTTLKTFDKTALEWCLGSKDPNYEIAKYLENFELFKNDPWFFMENQALPFNELSYTSLEQLLLWSIALNYYDVFEKLLTQGISPNTCDEYRFTALMYASMLNRKDMVKALVIHPKININARNKYGKNAMQLAADRGYWNIATWLLMAQKYQVAIAV